MALRQRTSCCKRAGERRRRLKCDRIALKYLRILYWNIASIHQRRPILQKLLYGNDIIVLQETRLRSETVREPGFQCFHNRQHLGQAILVRDDIPVSEVDMSEWNSGSLQVHAIRVTAPVQLVVVNVYACNGVVDTSQWQSLFDLDERNVIYCGDWNARGSDWGNTITNKQGDDLEDALFSAILVCLNNGEITRMTARPGDQ